MYGRTRRIHFVGIGGSGMSGIAEVMLTMGYEVSGSDLKTSEATDRLVRLGGRVFAGHSPSNVEGAQVVVFSTAVGPDNAELVAARARGLPVIGRAEMLAELMRMKYGIAVGGSHGKTTTTSMVAAVLGRGGLDPTIVVGGRLHALGANARLGHGQFLVAEADESDGSFLRLSPAVSVITNIDREHLDHFGDFDRLREAFSFFANRVPFYGAVVLCIDDPEVGRLLPRVTKRFVRYGLAEDAEVRATDVRLVAGGATFAVTAFGRPRGEITLHVPGLHNVRNALAAVAVGLEVEVAFTHIAEALAGFRGVARRFDLRGTQGDVRVVDDYAHHPTEIRATLAAARTNDSRVFAVFQPHRFTRTSALASEFGAAFADAERVWVLDVYPAGEAPIPGASADRIVAEARAQGFHHLVHAPDGMAAAAEVAAAARPGDLILTLGAGDVWKLADEVLRRLAAGTAVQGGRR